MDAMSKIRNLAFPLGARSVLLQLQPVKLLVLQGFIIQLVLNLQSRYIQAGGLKIIQLMQTKFMETNGNNVFFTAVAEVGYYYISALDTFDSNADTNTAGRQDC